MPFDRLKSHATMVVALVVVVAAIVGIWLFVISLRPCRLRLEPGTLVDYQLRTEWAEISEDGTLAPPRVREQRITLACIGDGNEVALVAPDHEQGDQVTLMAFAPDGTARRFDDERLLDEGKALGFFDFNLLPLPPGSEQAWNVSLVYALLPPGKRQVMARVKRRSNSAKPEFELKLPTIEWVENERYRQVKNLTCSYRFDGSRGVVDRATVRCDTGVERDDGRRRFRVTATLELVAIDRAGPRTTALRDLAVATDAAERALVARRTERLAPLLERLATADAPPALRAVVARLRADVEAAQRPPVRWALQVDARAKADAERLAARLAAAGLPARAGGNAGRSVRIGPFQEPDEALRARVARAGGSGARWIRLD